ncbi:cytidylate kinase-like family protein [Ruminococcus sp. FC2018]|uniref:cytidylate kinase-like family protein n=1 Tax=Ruminococcus sp. FC2018 TaxID=1410617 RepID=UPI00049199B2|nr:cytidylate kinase-like family protein [Ruminococcus sp. FC2018]
MAKIKVVTIGRRFCAGGSDIGKLAAEKLGVKCYDRELVEQAAEKVGVPMTEVAKYEESMMNWLKTPINIFGQSELTLAEKIFAAEAEIILDICSKEPCVIVGRCADYILKNKVKTLSVFITAPLTKRVQNATENHGIEYEDVEDRLKKYDTKRAKYYSSNTNKVWGSIDSYDICLDSGKLGYETCADIIAKIVEMSE